MFGAEDEIRTRDPDLGKVVLYQLSYFCKNKNQKQALEQKTRFELATPTLARSCSTS